jgi:hypothetical protein
MAVTLRPSLDEFRGDWCLLVPIGDFDSRSQAGNADVCWIVTTAPQKHPNSCGPDRRSCKLCDWRCSIASVVDTSERTGEEGSLH